LTRGVTVTGSRKIKSVVDSSVSAQTVNLADAPNVTLQIIQGVSGTTPLASLPADTATAYNFGLAMVTVTNGYTSGSAISAGVSAGGTTFISQLWSGGFIQPSRYRSLRMGSLVNKAPGTTGKPTMPLSDRWCASYRLVCPVKITGTNQVVTLDDSINWSSRMLGIRAFRAGALTNTAVVGLEYPASYPNGINGVSFYIPTWFAVGAATVSDLVAQGGNGYWTFSLGAASSLVATYGTQALASGTGVSDQWWFDIDYTDRMIF